MFSLWTMNGELVESFDTVELAILWLVQHWHEDDVYPAYTIRAENAWLVEATVCPIGSDSLKIIRRSGEEIVWSSICYNCDEAGRYISTTAIHRGEVFTFPL